MFESVSMVFNWSGLVDMPWWGYVLVTLVLTQISIASVTIYLHRHQAHRALDLHTIPSHFFRFWVWLTTAMLTPEWVAVHRKHHAAVETDDDPHSPKRKGLRRVLLEGTELYTAAARDKALVKRYSHGTPNDWLENNVYSAWRYAGVVSMLIINVTLFGWVGLTMWAVQMMWMPLFAAGTINGIGHWSGYRNFETQDTSTNIVPWGIFIGGEELHNNHHAFGSSAKLSVKPWEFDIGWMYISILSALKLATVKKRAPKPVIDTGRQHIDMDTLSEIITNRLHVMAEYAQRVTKPVLNAEKSEMRDNRKVLKLYARVKRSIHRERSLLDDANMKMIEQALSYSASLKVVYEFREELKDIWEKTAQSNDALLASLQEWCHRAEETGIEVLEDFAARLKTYGSPSMVTA